jgi:hypothetical protein
MAMPMAVRKLLVSGGGGRLERDVAPWKLGHQNPVSPAEQQSDNDYSDNDSVANKGSSITVIESLEQRATINEARRKVKLDGGFGSPGMCQQSVDT